MNIKRPYLVIFVVATVVIVAAALAAWQALPAADDSGSTRGDGAQTASVVAASGTLDEEAADTNQSVPFHLTLSNASDHDLLNVRITQVGTSTIGLARADWCLEGTDRAMLAQRTACVVSPSLAPRQSVSVSGTLRASTATRGNVTATVEWTEDRRASAGTNTASRWIWSRSVVPVGVLAITPRWARLTVALFSSLPMWALPIILAALGYAFQQRLSTLQGEREGHATDRSEKSDAWRTMLPVSHEYAVRYYAPLITFADSLVQNTRKVLKSPPADPNRQAALNAAFYALLMFQVRRNSLVNNTYYFKNHVGEQLVTGLITAYSRLFIAESAAGERAATQKQETARRLLDRACASLDPEAKKHSILKELDFERRVGGGASVDLMDWLSERVTRADPGEAVKLEEALSYLDAYCAILLFEMNRPYARWFDKRSPLVLTDEQTQAIRKMVVDVGATDPQLAAIGPELNRYFKEAGD